MAVTIGAARERERQRVEHLVLGRPRPKLASGKGRAKRKTPVQLDATVEPFVVLREDWSHKQGCPETHAHAAFGQEGSLARLYRSGAIDGFQLDAAAAIAAVAAAIVAGVNVRTVSLEAQIDRTRMGDEHFFESLGRVRAEVAYGRWRAALRADAAPLLELIVEDRGLVEVARRHGMGHRRLRARLSFALDLWQAASAAVKREIDRADLDIAHARILS